MTTLLFVNGSPKPVEKSKSLTLAREFLQVYRETNPDHRIEEVRVYSDPIPFLDAEVLETWDKALRQELLSEAEQAKARAIEAYTDQFVAADKYVFATPMWNLSITPMMKAYIDTFVIVGKTFRYTEAGPIGLLKGKNKKAVHIHARGGLYSQPPGSDFDFADRYITSLFHFLGVEDVQSIILEGHEYAPQQVDELMRQAMDRARQVAQAF